MRLSVLIGLVVGLALPDMSRAADPVFEAGAATIDITPPVGMPMWGYGSRHDKPNEGTKDPLEANAVVLGVGDQRIAIVGLDLGRAPTKKYTDSIRKRVAESADVDSIFLVGSHTHHGPILELETIPSPEKPYVKELEDKLVEVITQAAKKLKPAKWAIVQADVQNRNRNRHSKRPDPPIDRQLSVIRLVTVDNKPIATLVNFAAHPTSLPDSLMLWSADFPGGLKDRLEQELGGVAVFLQGAEGDLSTNRGGEDYAGFGRVLAEDTIKLLKKAKPVIPAKPSIQYVDEELHFKKENMRVNLGNPILKTIYSRAFFPELVDAFIAEYKDGVKPHLTVAIINGELGIVGASGEFFCEHSINLKKRSKLPYTIFLGCCNDYHQYFPTIDGAAEGGYGADPTVSPVEIGAGETIMNRALFHIYNLQGAYRWNPFGR